MIARIPGENKTFMGEHVEIVCLLQAAEIERLIDSLEDYKLRCLAYYTDSRSFKREIWTGIVTKFR